MGDQRADGQVDGLRAAADEHGDPRTRSRDPSSAAVRAGGLNGA
ncbi:hypothetical protein [Streptomyces phaeoluteigriseus]